MISVPIALNKSIVYIILKFLNKKIFMKLLLIKSFSNYINSSFVCQIVPETCLIKLNSHVALALFLRVEYLSKKY